MSNLPPGWIQTNLENVARWSSGGTPKTGRSDYYDGEIPWAVIGDLNDGPVVKTAATISDLGLANSSAKIVHPGTVLIAMYGGSIGKLGVAAVPMATNQAIAAAVPFDGVSREWLFWWLSFQKRDFISAGKGGAQPNISQTVLKDWPIPLAPICEQDRIVSGIEEAFSKLDAGEAGLQKVRRQLNNLRDSVLNAGITGCLVPQVHSEFDSDKHWNDWFSPKEDPFGGSQLPQLPRDWEWKRAAEVCAAVESGGTPPSQHMSAGFGEVPFVKVYNLTMDGRLDFTVNPTFIDSVTHKKQSRCRAIPGDVLTNIVGPPLGKIALVPVLHPEWNMNQAVVVFRALPGLRSRFLLLALRSQFVMSRLSSTAKATAGQFNVSLTACRYLPLPIPPLGEQDRIVEEVDRQLSFVEAAERVVDAALLRSAALRRSILKAAFEGKLVPQDPTDEPASVLLDRIRSERLASASTKPKKTRAKVSK
jgi:type I restriction enzyme, S subunit